MISEELEVLKIVVEKLQSLKIKYIISGSIAANFYSRPRMTRDIDIVIELSQLIVKKIYNLFKDDFYIDEGSVEEAVKNRSMFNIIHNEKVIKIDFIIAQDTDFEKVKFQRAPTKSIGGINLSIISPEDLILSKLLWAKDSHSEIQLNDVKNILYFMKDELDYHYLEKWADKLAIKNLFKDCQNV